MLLLTSLLLFYTMLCFANSPSKLLEEITNTTDVPNSMRDVIIDVSPYEKFDGLDSHEYNYYDNEDTDCFSDLTRCIYASPQSYPVCAYDVRERRYVDFFDLCEIELQNCELGYNYTSYYKDRLYNSPRYLLTGDGILCMAYIGSIPTPYSRRANEIYNNLLNDDEFYNVTNMRPNLNITELLKYHFKSPIFIKEYITDSAYIRKLSNFTIHYNYNIPLTR